MYRLKIGSLRIPKPANEHNLLANMKNSGPFSQIGFGSVHFMVFTAVASLNKCTYAPEWHSNRYGPGNKC